MDELEIYRSVYEENKAKFEITPWFRPALRAKRKNELLRSWASLRGAGIREARPQTSNALMRELKKWDWPFISALLGIFGVPIGIIIALILLINPTHPWEKPLPPGIHQNGYGFDIDRGVIDKKESGGGSAPFTSHDLCYRLPDTDGYDAKIKAAPGGGLRIDCKIGQ